MSGVVADTHTIIWYLLGSTRLSTNALSALDTAIAANEKIYIASISVVEVLYLVEKGKLPNPAFEQLNTTLAESNLGLVVVPLDLAVGK